jgi:peptidoglycan hydrolase-like protein with peptidoglycan-binding domain
MQSAPGAGKGGKSGTAGQTQAPLSAATIKSLQEALNKLGIQIKADGVLGNETRAALRRYQTEHHLPVTGEPDKATLDKLGVAAAQGTPSRSGMKGSGQGMKGSGQGTMGPGMMGGGKGMMGSGGGEKGSGPMQPGSPKQ